MKKYVTLFEGFEEAFDDFHQKPDTRSDSFYHRIAKDLIKMANQYSSEELDIDQYSEKYGTASRIKDLQNDLITKIYDEYGERVADDFAKESDSMLKSHEIYEKSMSHKKIFSKNTDLQDRAMQKSDKTERSKVSHEMPGKTARLRPKNQPPIR